MPPLPQRLRGKKKGKFTQGLGLGGQTGLKAKGESDEGRFPSLMRRGKFKLKGMEKGNSKEKIGKKTANRDNTNVCLRSPIGLKEFSERKGGL